jgi:hypothetical protein
MSESLWQAVQHETDRQRTPPQVDEGIDTPAPPASAPTTERPESPSVDPSQETTNTRTFERPEVRPIQRRPYDFYFDQILWMKEMKLALEKRYGKTIAANAMVQLALDMLIEDYERNRERSKLVTVLVTNQT